MAAVISFISSLLSTFSPHCHDGNRFVMVFPRAITTWFTKF